MPLSTCGVEPAKSISTSPRALSIVTAALQRDHEPAGEIEARLGLPAPGRAGTDRVAHRLLGEADDLVGEQLDVRQTVALAQIDQLFAAGARARDLRGEVAGRIVRRAHVAHDDVMQHGR